MILTQLIIELEYYFNKKKWIVQKQKKQKSEEIQRKQMTAIVGERAPIFYCGNIVFCSFSQ